MLPTRKKTASNRATELGSARYRTRHKICVFSAQYVDRPEELTSENHSYNSSRVFTEGVEVMVDKNSGELYVEGRGLMIKFQTIPN
ncbi:MAG: hypothetical protein KJ718_02695 [Nanoarchaeota archaeon]|nr:hypothetical protein [Nanoarchaeota archaeon]MBU1051438.1 hypothetical protein [Nanoarchaeota archaeon]MBU1988645.1 hypothetical protein [Nanoarchaeota archaeon]